MKVILSNQCESLTGMLERGLGYFLQARRTKSGKVNYYSQRSKHGGPPDGQWRFILTCANLAKVGLHVQDLSINWMELQTALYDARKYQASEHVRRNYADKAKVSYNAADILNLKTLFGL